jgi:hypothetical protein
VWGYASTVDAHSRKRTTRARNNAHTKDNNSPCKMNMHNTDIREQYRTNTRHTPRAGSYTTADDAQTSRRSMHRAARAYKGRSHSHEERARRFAEKNRPRDSVITAKTAIGPNIAIWDMRYGGSGDRMKPHAGKLPSET